MLVYGDVEQRQSAAAVRTEVAAILAGLAASPAGLARHADLVAAFLRAADLVQGLIDCQFVDCGEDTDNALTQDGMRLLTLLAGSVDRSWRSGFAAEVDEACVGPLLAALPERSIVTKPAEGYAFYAVYPESYAEAARRSDLPRNTRVIGIRSIGASVAAMVAAALGAEPPVTVRPTGHPFARTLGADRALTDAILRGHPPAFAVVDEGPGLSGSSFGCVADWLEARGVPRDRIHFFPSHGGDLGPEASELHRRRWQECRRHHVTFDELLLSGGPTPRLEAWLAEQLGPLDLPLIDISGGEWQLLARKNANAPVAPRWERRKFLAQVDGRRWLVKFAGIGAVIELKLKLARELESTGMTPRIAGEVYGFLIEEWVDGTPLDGAFDRTALVERLVAYLAARAAILAPADAGASWEQLARMAENNVSEALGATAGAYARQRVSEMERYSAELRRVEIDGRMHRWEWLVRDGALLKTDALDHGRGHDCIGAQDISWDIAGTVVEHGLTMDETSHLLAALRTRGIDPPAGLRDAMMLAYLSFQLGAWTMSNGINDPLVLHYRQEIEALLTLSPAP